MRKSQQQGSGKAVVLSVRVFEGVEAGITGSEILNNLPGSITGAVIHHNDFKITEALGQNALQRLLNIKMMIVAGYNNGYGGYGLTVQIGALLI